MIFEDPKILIKDELKQLEEEGYNVSDIQDSYDWFQLTNGKVDLKDARHLFYEYSKLLEKREDFGYVEPSDINEIIKESEFEEPKSISLNNEQLFDKIYGAALGRAAGCILGKPIEGWSRSAILDYLAAAGEKKLKFYFPKAYYPKIKFGEHEVKFDGCFREDINMAVRDDDLDYTIVNLKLLEDYGFDFSTANVGKIWLENLPFGSVYTAERAAYRNLVTGLHPPKTATFMNPYREWIGAQIRGDVFGWVSPGNPSKAAKLAYKDAKLSHVKNGIYGEMFVAAMLANAFYYNEPMQIILEALKYVPKNSRFHEAITIATRLYSRGIEFENAWKIISEKYGHYNWVHTINNACFVVLALLYGKGDFENSVCYAVECGSDTDCNGATVGSIVGLLNGAKNLPSKWIKPLNDTLQSFVPGFNIVKISELAKRILHLLKK